MQHTITDIADIAGVSVATVSHVINNSRYVSPELRKKVEDAIKETGYQLGVKSKNFSIQKLRKIALVLPNISSEHFSKIAFSIQNELQRENCMLEIFSCNENIEFEKMYIRQIALDKKIDGVILALTSIDTEAIEILRKERKHIVLIDRNIEGLNECAVMTDNKGGLFNATSHLIKSGHNNIGLALWTKNLSTTVEREEGYRAALEKFDIEYNESLVKDIGQFDGDIANMFDSFREQNRKLTAIICCSNTITQGALRYCANYGVEVPRDWSIIGCGDYEWSNMIKPPLTTFSTSPQQIAKKAVEKMMEAMNGEDIIGDIVRVPIELNVRESTQSIGRGPLGEMAAKPEVLTLSDQEEEQVRKGGYSAAISFHYSGSLWMRLHEKGIKDVFNKLNIRLLSVTDAHFDADMQNKQLKGLLVQEPDAIISIPTDEEKTSESFKEIADSRTRLVLINNVPDGLTHDDYVTCVSVNERQSGRTAGKLMGDLFKNKGKTKIGLIKHGAPFFATKQRDFAAEQVLVEQYDNIEIVAKENFYSSEKVFNICKDMLRRHPDIKGLYVSWEGPAMEAARALEEMDREDVSIVTVDLDINVAMDMAKGHVIKGLSAQRPYEQGEAVAYAVANALLGKKVEPFIGVEPYAVSLNNLSKAWKDIVKTKEPDELLEAIKAHKRFE